MSYTALHNYLTITHSGNKSTLSYILAGLEKTLRLLQSISQVVGANLLPAAAAPWLRARAQFALGRRYLRFLKFIDAFSLAFETLSSRSGVVAFLEFGKWSCLGMFLLLESCTILYAMGVYRTSWASWLFVEAVKFWFYSLCFGILRAIYELWNLSWAGTSHSTEAEGGSGKVAGRVALDEDSGRRQRTLQRQIAMKKLVIEGCDLFTPGAVTGWLVVSSGNVGMLCLVSTVFAGADVWDEILGT
ncbi:related to PEX11 domain protein [Rhynchosporium graminicola]|uniref:Related to PEX11 domain protein n=1 Tax=Rhynchosporium graminicola TaxID=2792576 RepID=A0A1E1KRH4_9HELO|nr:related to PEX11 domain protein [Rhynchosporium commune]